MQDPRPAVLLLGPTGSGKTPLGDYLARRGYRGRRAAHFDFGAQLRAAAAGARGLPAGARAVVQRVLAEGALLEDAQFGIAARILDGFLDAAGLAADDWVVLNGLPRHAGQAHDLAAQVDVRDVVVLACSAETVRARIRRDTGGDRAARVDDAPAEVERKLALYAARTAPLVAYYRAAGARVMGVPVGVETRPATIVNVLRVYGNDAGCGVRDAGV